MANEQAKTSSPLRHLSMLGAWALAFGCAVGSDAFVMPWNDFLPMAGPLGTLVGLLLGGLAMAVVAWNYHYMINHRPGAGGVYAYAAEAFGYDHGFLCGIFFGFAYLAIVCLDVTALVVVSHYVMGDALTFGFHYTVEGSRICLGDILLSLAAIGVIVLICCRSRLSYTVQFALAIVFVLGIVACFASVAFHACGSGAVATGPLFSPKGDNGFGQVLKILTIAPWIFVGFESISNSSGEFSFPVKRSFWVMLSALGTAVAAYLMLTAIPMLAPGDAFAGWPDAVNAEVANREFRAFDMACRFFGPAGRGIIGVTLFGAIVTNLVGNTIAVSRLAAAMADDGALPAWLGRKNADGSPRNAVLAIAVLAVLMVPLGRVVIGVVVDISILGAAIAYAYTSAATFKIARRAGNRCAQATGALGFAISLLIALPFALPFLTFATTHIATESYLILIVWSLASLAVFLTVFHRDGKRRFGRSSVVWISVFIIIVLLSVMWVRQKTEDAMERAYADILGSHAKTCASGTVEDGGWQVVLRESLSSVNGSVFRNNLVQVGLNLLAIILMFGLYSILRRRERQVEREKSKAKSYFFSTVSHDIRTPLNAIIGYSEMLKTGFKTETERKEAINSILVSSKTLLGLVNDVLDISKLESGKMEILPRPTDCPNLMRAVVEAFRVTSDNAALELRYRAGEMPLLMLDPQRLRQIVFNLVGNAVKFTVKGHVELRASFARRKGAETGEFRLDVEDTGCGISEEDLAHVGVAYVQVGSRNARNGGTGLGLAICKQLAAAMGGRLEVESVLGKGSTFSVVIPEVRVAPAGEPCADTPGTPPNAARASLPAAQEPGKMPHRILIVDDSKMNLMVLKALLKNIGKFDVTLAMDGEEALKILVAPETKPFDLVLSDLWMPNMDGGDLVRAIRANPALASLRVIVVTADVESQATFAKTGFNGILLKPVTAEKLRKVLEEGEHP